MLSYGMVKKPWLYYILSIVWGLPLTIIGYLLALVLLPFGKLERVGLTYCLILNRETSWGMSIGTMIFIGRNSVGDRRMLEHEYGHTFQNAIFGPFTLFLVSIPSAVRFWIRQYMYAHGKTPKTDYDSVWFEGSASKIGLFTIPF